MIIIFLLASEFVLDLTKEMAGFIFQELHQDDICAEVGLGNERNIGTLFV